MAEIMEEYGIAVLYMTVGLAVLTALGNVLVVLSAF